MIGFFRVSTWDPEFVAAIRRHYTGSAGAPPGKKMAWRIEEGGITIGWIGLSEPSARLGPRRRLGIDDIRPLPHTVSVFIYRLEAPHAEKASTILDWWHHIATHDWDKKYGWRPVHWETMIGLFGGKNPGGCFKAAGYRSLGMTSGRSARRPAGATHAARVWTDSAPKLVLYRGPLHRLPSNEFEHVVASFHGKKLTTLRRVR